MSFLIAGSFVYNEEESCLYVGVNPIKSLVLLDKTIIPHRNKINCPLINGHFCYYMSRKKKLKRGKEIRA